MDPRESQVPPHDADLEAKVCGLLVRWPDTVAPVMAVGLTADHFYVPRFARAFQAIADLVEMGEPVDPHHLWARLGDHDLACEVTAAVADAGPWSAEAWARLLIEFSACRRAITPSCALSEAALAGSWSTVRSHFKRLKEVVCDDVA